MKLVASTTGAFLAALITAAAAQTPPDNAAVLKAIQKLTQRLERLEKKVDSLSAAEPSSTVSPAAATPSPVRKAVAQKVTVKGWQVDVVPGDNETKEPIATFDWDKSDFNFGLHTKYVSSHNLYIYRGAATFYPDQKDRYVFELILEPVRTGSFMFNCAGTIKIGDEVVADGKANTQSVEGTFDRNGEIFGSSMASGGVLLEPPAYSDEAGHAFQ